MTDASERLKGAREAAGYESAPAAADAMGIPQPTYMAHENGSRGFTKSAERYAKFFRTTPEWLLFGTKPGQDSKPPVRQVSANDGVPVDIGQLRGLVKELERRVAPAVREVRLRQISRRVPIVGEVAAGLWKEAAHRHPDDEIEHLPIDVPGYERADLRAYRVTGPSMNEIYPEGRFVVVAHPAEAGLRVGDVVIVERHKADLVEITLKEFTVNEAGRIELWPRSNHPDFQTPILLDDRGEGDQTQPQIIGVVVADYGRRERPPIVFDPRAAGTGR